VIASFNAWDSLEGVNGSGIVPIVVSSTIVSIGDMGVLRSARFSIPRMSSYSLETFILN